MARTGITNTNRIKEAPIRLPAKMLGFLSITELMPIESSGIEVKSPKTMKEIAKADIESFLENRSIPDTINPAENHTRKNEKMNTARSKTIPIESVYHDRLYNKNPPPPPPPTPPGGGGVKKKNKINIY